MINCSLSLLREAAKTVIFLIAVPLRPPPPSLRAVGFFAVDFFFFSPKIVGNGFGNFFLPLIFGLKYPFFLKIL